jgi:hypothetical protein
MHTAELGFCKARWVTLNVGGADFFFLVVLINTDHAGF